MIPENELKVERIRGSGPGGQRKNKKALCVRVTHLPTGISATHDGRNQHANLVQATKELEKRLAQRKAGLKAKDKKARRDKAIHDKTVIRTYNFQRGTVKDHRNGKVASLKDVMGKGQLDLLQ